MQNPIERILVPVDYSDPGRHAGWIALAIARSMQASLSLMHVLLQERAQRVTVQIDADKLPALTDELFTELLMELVGEPTVRSLRDVFSGGNSEIVPCSFSPDEEITAYANQQKTDLIVIGANVHSKVHDLLMGSVSTEVLKNAKCSVTVVH